MVRNNKKIAYWLSQLLGWGAFVFISAISKYIESGLSRNSLILLLVILFLGLLLSHTYRNFIIKNNWLRLSILSALPRVLFSAFALAATMSLSQLLFTYIMEGDVALERVLMKPQELILICLNWLVIFIVWSVIYFALYYFEKSRNEEIKNLRLESMRKEVELNNLKSQLNPHFMFNAMNSIRALIDENPDMAKKSITGLSNILRNSLILGRKQLIKISEELSIVKDYLALEKVRYEERLSYQIHCDDELLNNLIPPLMIQTLTENAIKHGISKLTQGGNIDINIFSRHQKIQIEIINCGTLNKISESHTAVGIKNTKQRLELLFGKDFDFNLSADSNTKKVMAHITLPATTYDMVNNFNIQN